MSFVCGLLVSLNKLMHPHVVNYFIGQASCCCWVIVNVVWGYQIAGAEFSSKLCYRNPYSC